MTLQCSGALLNKGKPFGYAMNSATSDGVYHPPRPHTLPRDCPGNDQTSLHKSNKMS